MNAFNKFVLRRLYNVEHSGRGEAGVVRRKEFKITLTPRTYLALRNVIEVGPGQYGSSVMELSIRSLLAAMGVLPTDEFIKLCEELALSVVDREQFAQSMIRIATIVGNYKDTGKIS